MAYGMVWVLSEEAPFSDPAESGGCVCGVFDTAIAALYYLGHEEIGSEGLAKMTWNAYGPACYEGRGYGEAVYILRAYGVQDDAGQRRQTADLERFLHLPVSNDPQLCRAALAALLPGYMKELR